jgi:cyclopropane-fatty-acyl-phospholipid synthase
MNAPANTGIARRLETFKRLLTHIRDLLSLDFGFVLWDGTTVPADLPSDALAVVLADEGIVAAILRRPNADTLLNLWVAARIDIRNGVIFDFLSHQPGLRTKEIRRRVDKGLALRAVRKFLFLSRGGPWPLETVRGREARRDGSEETNKENIHYHYDLSNAFYALFLDPEMVYSCAYFRDWNNDLATAQRDKLDMICRKLRLKPGESFLDIGCGWGALVTHAAKNYGVRAHGVTLAEEQFTFAKEKIARLGLQDRVTIELKDYSRLDGTFDKIASIGMFEHVGYANHERYFAAMNRLLKPEGLYLHHAITRTAKRNDRAFFNKNTAEARAIARYIFPGGELDHIGMTAANLERHGFEVHDVEAWREHYARTTRLWHDRLLANFAAAEREVGAVKTRMWLIYLAGVSIAFERAKLGIFQTLASKRRRGASGVPLSRADLYR